MPSQIYPHSYKPPAQPLYHNGELVLMGVELELAVSCDRTCDIVDLYDYALDNHVDRCYYKRDGSISGLEIVTHPQTVTIHRQMWKSFFERLRNHWLYDKIHFTQCGLHVHLSREGLSAKQIMRMRRFVNSERNYSFMTAIADREENYYCVYKSRRAKYCAVNTLPQKTIEFRIFKATTKFDRMMIAIEFVLALSNFFAYDPPATKCSKEYFSTYVVNNATVYPELSHFIISRNNVKLKRKKASN